MLLWLIACSSPPPAPVDRSATVLQPGVPWKLPWRPTMAGDWHRASPEDVGLDPTALQALHDYVFARNGDDHDRLGQRTNALLIIRHNQVVYEHYARGTTADTRLLHWSVSKSIGNLVLGAAVKDGLITLDDPACQHYGPMCGGGRQHVRITDLLQMSSGLDWNETYETSPVFSSVTGMLYSRGSDDMARFAASQPMAFTPGTHWRYSSGDANILSAVLKSPLDERYDRYAWTALFEPLGVDPTYERDAAGTYVASSYLYSSAQDLARFGQLMLNDGIWNGQRLLAPGWVRYSTSMAPAFYSTPVSEAHHRTNPSAQWYVNIGDAERGLDPPWPALPADAFGASGHWGKQMWVIPSWDLVVVRLGDDRRYGCEQPDQQKCTTDPKKAFTKSLFLEHLAAAVQPHAPPPPPLFLPDETP